MQQVRLAGAARRRVATNLQPPDLGLVRMPGGRTAGWVGGGEEGEGEEEGWVPCGVPAERWLSARRQVRPPGERAPGLPPSLVGWARLQ